MQITPLHTHSILPLTCSRSGTCCYGKVVNLNPWELFQLSKEKKSTPKAFRDRYCDFGGIRLKFNGSTDVKGQQACSQYVDGLGCSVHLGRPLACRLYPLGRQIQNDNAHYIYQGDQFPCLTDCAEVLELPKLSVGEYLKGQAADPFEKGQDEYLKVMQNIADIAFELLLESGLSASGDTNTLKLWKTMANELPEELTQRIGHEWMDALMLPAIIEDVENPIAFAQQHTDLLLLKAQESFGTLTTLQEFHDAATLTMGIALHLARGLGVDQQTIAEHWIATAKQHGAQE
jgi:Fe-S-cluster containining protein